MRQLVLLGENVDVEIDQRWVEPSRLRRLIEGWYSSRSFRSVELCVNTAPSGDYDQIYTVFCELKFKSDRLELPYTEIWITTAGDVGIGFERWSRIARRMGVVCRRDRFVGGHEPRRVLDGELIAILDAIAGGNLAVLPMAIPFFGLLSARTVMRSVERSELGKLCEGSIDWVYTVSDVVWRHFPILEYESWDEIGY